MKPSNLYKYFKGESEGGRRPGSDVLLRLTEAGCNVRWLLSGEGEMFTEDEVKRMMRSELARPTPIGEPLIYGRPRSADDWKRIVDDELLELRAQRAKLAGEDPVPLLLEEIKLLEKKAEMLLQENLIQLGQIITYERILGPLGANDEANDG